MTLLREQHYQFIPVCEVCVRGGLHLAIKSQIHVVGWNLEHQSSWFSPFGHRGFVDGGGEKWDVVVNVWRRKWRGRRSELRISWKLPVDLIETSLMIDGLFTKLKLAPAPDHNIHPTVSSPYLWLSRQDMMLLLYFSNNLSLNSLFQHNLGDSWRFYYF